MAGFWDWLKGLFGGTSPATHLAGVLEETRADYERWLIHARAESGRFRAERKVIEREIQALVGNEPGTGELEHREWLRALGSLDKKKAEVISRSEQLADGISARENVVVQIGRLVTMARMVSRKAFFEDETAQLLMQALPELDIAEAVRHLKRLEQKLNEEVQFDLGGATDIDTEAQLSTNESDIERGAEIAAKYAKESSKLAVSEAASEPKNAEREELA